ncbi:phospholipase A2 inhibitor and Ly6/PLAUR domain-containing protein-like isoform X2 [Erythrolamprus reginae]|uniref:phospholipase A2 inhibitor and Ly6/PLAUR domain-containing protein-like isoform X2 n=1 Tax=Erythrolamprus reginae TaxID=121349 RepID=UPI00396CC071
MNPGLVVFFCLISSVLLTGVTSIQCYKCFSTGGQCRNEDMTLVECEPDETSCVSLIVRTTFSIPSVVFSTKTCAKPEEANNGYFSLTSVQKKHFELLVHSCQTDGCNIMPVSLPSRDVLKPNGLTCPGSFTSQGTSSLPPQPLVCLGNESRCGRLEFTMRILRAINEEIFVEACVTDTVCAYPMGETQMGNGIAKFNVNVKNCSFALQSMDNMLLNM